MAELYRKLEKYKDMDYYPFHMPGHKRCMEAAEGALSAVYGMDITEIDGFDNLHQAQEILREEQEKAAKLYGSKRSYYLVNGSTCGILSAVFAVTKRGDRILMGRNCHKAVYHAVYLRELEAVYLQPEVLAGKDGWDFGLAGGIEPEAVEKALKANPDYAAVIITSPTYEGVISDVKRIARIVHSYGIPLIVDEAHGAHFGFHEAYPASSVRQEADLVIHSVHKTLPAMTQSALLHWNHWSGYPVRHPDREEERTDEPERSLADRRRVERYLRIFQTSSPSYVLMASVSYCMEMVQREGWERLDRLLKYRYAFMQRIEKCHYVKVFEGETRHLPGQYDPCKLVIGVADGRMTGQELYDVLLKKYHLQMEMATEYYILAIVTMMDTKEGWNRLADALLDIDYGLFENETAGKRPADGRQIKSGHNLWCSGSRQIQQPAMTIAEAYEARQETVALADSSGRIAAEFINLYPPGIPLAVPGEKLTEEMVEALMGYRKLGLRIQGVEKGLVRVIKV